MQVNLLGLRNTGTSRLIRKRNAVNFELSGQIYIAMRDRSVISIGLNYPGIRIIHFWIKREVPAHTHVSRFWFVWSDFFLSAWWFGSDVGISTIFVFTLTCNLHLFTARHTSHNRKQESMFAGRTWTTKIAASLRAKMAQQTTETNEQKVTGTDVRIPD